MIGDRRANLFLSSAGLGITGAFEPVLYTVDWKEGEHVDEARALRTRDTLKEGLNSFPDYECSSVELVRLWQE
jgi:hypothetical protein